MRVVLLPADDNACGRYRMVWPGNHLRRTGHDVIVNRFRRDHEVQIRIENVPSPTGGWLVHDVQPVDADMVVFQRPNTQRLYATIKAIQRQGVKVGVDIDDALWSVHPRNLAWQNYNGNTVTGPHWRWLLKACDAADIVTCSTPELAERFRHAVVVPNFIPAHMLGHARSKIDVGVDTGYVSVGWGATITTHWGDPDVTDGRIPGVVRSHNAGFLSVGGRQPEVRAFGFDNDDIADGRAAFTGPVPMKGWIKALSQLDVSLVPLADTPFNRGKSWLKAIESAAAGAVPVMSPTPDNLRAREAGIGEVAASGQKWERKVRRLVEDHEYRHQQAKEGLAAVEGMTVEENSWRWMEAWESAF